MGTITRCLSIADHLRRLGHECLFLTNGEGAKLVSEEGFPFVEGVLPDPPGKHHPVYDLSDVAVFLNLTREGFIRRSLETELRTVDRFTPDVLFSEFKLTAPITAAVTGVPLVSTACSPADPRFVSPLFPGAKALNHADAVEGFNRVLDDHKLEAIENTAELFFSRSDVKVAPTVCEIEPLLEDVPDIHYTGYLLHDRRELAALPQGLLENAGSRAIVFVYFSTGEIEPDAYIHVIPQAFQDSEYHAIVAVGDHPDVPELPPSTSNTTWVRFVPGRSLMRHCRAVIFHGGQNTAVSSLIHKLPSLIFPGKDFERDFNARSLAQIGAGMHLSVDDFTPAKVLEATRRLQAPSFHAAVQTYSEKILRKGGPERAAEVVTGVWRKPGG